MLDISSNIKCLTDPENFTEPICCWWCVCALRRFQQFFSYYMMVIYHYTAPGQAALKWFTISVCILSSVTGNCPICNSHRERIIYESMCLDSDSNSQPLYCNPQVRFTVTLTMNSYCAINPFKSNVIFHCYQWDQSICILSVWGSIFSFYYIFY